MDKLIEILRFLKEFELIITKIIVKFVLSILFLCCFLNMPYGYYDFIKVIGMTSFIWLSYIYFSNSNKSLMIIWLCSAIIINPIFTIKLDSNYWEVLDLIWIGVLLYTLIADIKRLRIK